jgi:hypothetical protein
VARWTTPWRTLPVTALALSAAIVSLQPAVPRGESSQDPAREPEPPSARMDIRGPFLLTAREMERLPQHAARSGRIELTPQDADQALCEGCSELGFVPGGPLEELLQKTPPAAMQFSVDNVGFVDPQVAASSTHLVVTTTGRITFLEKSGALLGPKSGSPALTNPIAARDFFRAVWQDPNNSINNTLNLPAGAHCDPADPFADDTFCLNSYYDTRAIFDPYRKRFLIGALAINRNSKAKELVCGSRVDVQRRSSRRTKFLLGVSLTEDPRDGWWIYVWNAVVDDGACNNPAGCPGSKFLPGDAGDYPSIGIDKKFFTVTTAVGRRDPTTSDCDKHLKEVSGRYAKVVAIDADALAAGGLPVGVGLWDIPDPTAPGQVVTGIVQPALHHTPHPFARTLFAKTAGTNRLVIWGLWYEPAQNLLDFPAAVMPVHDWGAPQNAPQRATADFPAPNPLKMTNLGNEVLKTVYRDGYLYTTWFSNRVWDPVQPDASKRNAVRVNQTFVGFFPLMPDSSQFDRTFGLRNTIDDGPGAFVDYGWPTVETNKDGHIVVAYMRASPEHFPEARFSVRFKGEPDVRPSRLLMAGQMPYVDKDAAADAAIGQVDLGGSGVDPFDDEGIWFVQPYAFAPADPTKASRNFRLAVGKVFGRVRPDLTFAALELRPPFRVSAGSAVEVRLTIRNQGDGEAAGTDAWLFLEGTDEARAEPLRIAEVPLGPLPPGTSTSRQVWAVIPPDVPPGTYRVLAQIEGVGEYSDANNRERSSQVLTLFARQPARR